MQRTYGSRRGKRANDIQTVWAPPPPLVFRVHPYVPVRDQTYATVHSWRRADAYLRLKTPTNAYVDAAAAVPHAAPKPCGGARLRQKVTSLASAFRLTHGFVSDSEKEKEAFKALPFLTPGPMRVKDGKTADGECLRIVSLPPVRTPEGAIRMDHHHAHGRLHHKQRSFLMRVHFAFMNLGPWEGRAVAFVLDESSLVSRLSLCRRPSSHRCGIGVLLHMFWVLTILSFRVLRGFSSFSPNSNSWTTYPGAGEHEYLIVGEDAEDIFVAPPVYATGYPVEKVAVVEPTATIEAK
ncbi:hypothetical protein FB451DRAFT_1401734 [Mycena latifolia]|nr:hypothetical protein FB451DRAFT_1401734 [Mycena latifolia]